VSTASSPRVAARGRVLGGARPSALRALGWLQLTASGALASVLMLLWLGRPSLWFDETVSVEAAKLPTGTLARYVASTEVNMSLYNALLHVWLWLGGGDAWARGLSVLFGLATLPLVYALARRLFDVRTALGAVLLLAGNVEFVGHAREARGYSLAVLLVTASSLFLVRGVQDGRPRDWRLYALLGALAVYAHLLAVLAVLAPLGSLALVRRRIDARRAVEAAGLLALLLIPLVASLLTHWQGAQIDWVSAPRAKQLPGLMLWFAGSRPVVAIYAVGAFLAFAAGYRSWQRQRDAQRLWPYALLAALVVLPPLAAFVVSFAKPVYLYRYFLVSLPALAVLVAAGLARLGRLWILAPAVLAAAALSTRTTVECTPGCVIGDDDWRAAAGYVEARTRPGDGVIFVPKELRTAFEHYIPGSRRPRLLYPARWPLRGGGQEGDATLPDALARAASSRRVWLVTWWLPTGDVPGLLARARGPAEVHDFAGNVQVRLYGPTHS
jgi:mannosyltransferase